MRSGLAAAIVRECQGLVCPPNKGPAYVQSLPGLSGRHSGIFRKQPQAKSTRKRPHKRQRSSRAVKAGSKLREQRRAVSPNQQRRLLHPANLRCVHGTSKERVLAADNSVQYCGKGLLLRKPRKSLRPERFLWQRSGVKEWKVRRIAPSW